MRRSFWTGLVALLAVAVTAPAASQESVPIAPIVQSPDAALAQDAAAYAALAGLPPAEAERQLAAQQATITASDIVSAPFADRLAGIAIEHQPAFRIVVLLTGDTPVADDSVIAGDLKVPVVFRTSARASRAQLVAAITAHQADIRASLAHPPGMGVDQRTGELVIVVATADVDREGAAALKARLEAMAGVPVRLRAVDTPALDLSAAEGGGRMVGTIPGDPHHYLCTAGFVVTDGARTGIATAAHCPDDISYVDADRRETPLSFVGQWGWGYQDVQINVSAQPLAPFFFAATAKAVSRPVTGQRSLAGTRAGEVVCHRGETTGYSCAEVDLTDFAPAGDLCGGACLPTWVTVRGPDCKGGDSGGPVFLGTVAYGIVKGGSYRADGSCAFYFYMSTDYLPPGWSLLEQPTTTAPQPAESGVAPRP